MTIDTTKLQALSIWLEHQVQNQLTSNQSNSSSEAFLDMESWPP